MRHANRITTIQVFRSLGIEPTPNQSWSVGIRVANMYIKEYGEQPPKENRTKTSGVGVHCFALYPPEWQKKIAEVIETVCDEERRQLDMFPDE
jgi:hypothetical protein